MKPFDYLNSINFTKDNVMLTEEDEKGYVPFIVNRGLSYFIDTIKLANEINQRHHVDKKLQYEFLLNSIRKRKRFSKWHKREQDDDLNAVMEYYGYNHDKALQIIDLLTHEQLTTIKNSFNKGGRNDGGTQQYGRSGSQQSR